MSNLHSSYDIMNVSRNSTRNSNRETVDIIIESFIFVVIDFFAVLGNVLVCVIICHKPALRTPTNILIASLAMSDFSAATFFMPLTATASIANEWIFGNTLCQLQGYGMYYLGGVSLHTMMLTSLCRYLCVVRPLIYKKYLTARRSVQIASAPWLLTVVTALSLYFSGHAHFKTQKYSFICNLKFSSSFIGKAITLPLLVVYVIVPACVVILSYRSISRTLKVHSLTVARTLQAKTNVRNPCRVDAGAYCETRAPKGERTGKVTTLAADTIIVVPNCESTEEDMSRIGVPCALDESAVSTLCEEGQVTTLQNMSAVLNNSVKLSVGSKIEETTDNIGNVAHGRKKLNTLVPNVEEVRITKTVFTVIAGFCLCWLPVCVIAVLVVFLVQNSRVVDLSYMYLAYISSAINPVIYGVMNKSFRNEFLRVFRCK